MSANNPINLPRDNFEENFNAWEGDLWDRKRLGIQLTNYVDRLQCGAVLALDARWGEGKTWFVRHWQKHLENEGHNVIYLDAFANDYLDDPFLVISSEIASKLDKTADKRLVHKFKKAAAVMQQGLLTLAPTLIASMISFALTGGIIPLIKIDSDSIKDKLDDAIDKVTENIGDKVTEAIQSKIDSYEEEKQSLFAFKNTLAQLAESLDKPLVFIIDELDRCRPDFAIRLIERIKHFFDIKNIVFVLVMDKAQFSKVVCHNYGYDEELGEEYLDKFVDFLVPLPQINKSTPKEMITIPVLKKLFANVGEFSDDIVFIFYKSLDKYLAPREIKRKINNYALLKTGIVKKDIFLILKIQSGVTNLIRKIQSLHSEVESDVQKSNDSLNNITHYIKKNFSLEPNEFLELFKRLRELNHKTYAFSGGEKHKEGLRLKIYSEYAIKTLNNLEDFNEQFEDYLNVHLWDEMEKEGLN